VRRSCGQRRPHTDRRQAGGGTEEGRAIMAVAESRPAVPAVLYDVDEAAEALRLSRSVLYELIRSGRLRTVKQGRRRLVPVSALAEYVDSLGRRT
jgi:excisionase family DNA binding protein